MSVAISSCVIELIQSAAASALPNEGCGLLFGTAERIEAANIAANVANNPSRQFEIESAALFAAYRSERGGGPRVIGNWHSHPSGQAEPSLTDAAMALDADRLWLIVAGDAVTLWRTVPGGTLHGRFDAVPLALDQ